MSRYKQCHFRAGHEFIFKLDTNNNRRYAKRRDVYPTVLLPGPQNARAIYLSAGLVTPTDTDTHMHLCIFLRMQQRYIAIILRERKLTSSQLHSR